MTLAYPRPNPFTAVRRQSPSQANSTAQVDLGYAVYQGTQNSTTGLTEYKGIRFAQPPIGSLRWQPPQPPNTNRSSTQSASAYGSSCPQSPASTGVSSNFTLYSEDCLFLNVQSPANASNLPVLVWIHGGGYGAGNGQQDLSSFINANEDGIVGVSIQYRLGAFGFLSSDEVYRNGAVNAGLLDQQFALQWVQTYIDLFGGDPNRVTISGDSAGGGSVMLLDIAYGGTLGTSLFTNSISASPYLPQQYGYKDWIPSQSYYAFATAAGCPPAFAYGNSSQTIFECLVNVDTDILQNASAIISASGTFGSWGFLPVTDGTYIQETPSQALLKGKVNGLHQLSGNNADEGAPFTTHNITTEDDLVAWIHLVFPLFRNDDIAKLLYYYPSSNSSDTSLQYSTEGDQGATALNTSLIASGQQQRANNIYGETTFVCPSYWLAEAYSSNAGSVARSGYKYQYSVPLAIHGIDGLAYFGPPGPNLGPDFVLAFQRIWGNFIKTSNPSISASIAAGASASNSTTNATASSSPLENWPPFTLYDPYMANLNQSGGTPFQTLNGQVNITEFGEPGLKNNLELVNAYSWEGGRGVRCDFWKSVAALVPE
ncbi:Alpha/Beta hydrolase protein [Lophiotrema nucula]|uniref:Carboxylic ester hydrolase n=1 Tax=Lophiotrema nucula TaxID=690887 RepID=A0A6A5YHR5_9PLEO|nr:Alpha/Beta hydrolase protein [Lophiotrema nucula]